MIENEEETESEPDPEPAVSTTVGGPSAGGLNIAKGNNRVFRRVVDSGTRNKWGFYANQVQSSITSALKRNPKTRKASMQIDVKIWADSAGRITRVTLGSSTGDPALDAIIRDQVLTGLQLSQPPPEGMPMPINLRVKAQRPN